MNLKSLLATDKHATRTIQFQAGNRVGTTLVVTLDYLPPRDIEREQAKERLRVLGDRQANALSDSIEAERALTLFYYRILAGSIRKIDDGPNDEGMSIRKMSELLPLDPAMVKAAGGLDTKLPSKADDETPLTEQERATGGFPPEVTTRGHAARDAFFQLITFHDSFKNFVHQVSRDISMFQDAKFEEEVKNS